MKCHHTCQVTSMCGYNLRQGCIIVALMTVAISLLMFFYGMGCVIEEPPENGYNSDPSLAVQLIFGLFATSASLYQIIISLLLAWQAKLIAALDHEVFPTQIRRIIRLIPHLKENIFYCTLWHVSHLSILTFYFILYCAKAALCFESKDFVVGSMIAIIGTIYICIFIYFSMVVNSFSHSIDQDVYY